MNDDIPTLSLEALRPDPANVRAATTFSFRAECHPDALLFLSDIEAAGHDVDSLLHADTDGLPDVEVEIRVNATLEQLREILRSIRDSHVMLQTLRVGQLQDNTLERDYDVD